MDAGQVLIFRWTPAPVLAIPCNGSSADGNTCSHRSSRRLQVEELVADLTERVAKRIHECEELQIAHENIRKIDNLWGFERLTSLSLDNNWIDRMQGLDHLTTLTVLGGFPRCRGRAGNEGKRGGGGGGIGGWLRPF